jgi:hypothetical protein
LEGIRLKIAEWGAVVQILEGVLDYKILADVFWALREREGSNPWCRLIGDTSDEGEILKDVTREMCFDASFGTLVKGAVGVDVFTANLRRARQCLLQYGRDLIELLNIIFLEGGKVTTLEGVEASGGNVSVYVVGGVDSARKHFEKVLFTQLDQAFQAMRLLLVCGWMQPPPEIEEIVCLR